MIGGRFPRLFCYRDSCLHLPGEGLKMRIRRGQRGLQECICLAAGFRKIARCQPDIAQTQLRGHSPEPMQEEFGGRLRITNLAEVFDGLAIFPAMKLGISCSNPGDRRVLPSGIFRIGAHDEVAESTSTLEIESKSTQPCLAKIEQPGFIAILFCHLFSRLHNVPDVPEPANAEERDRLAAKREKLSHETSGAPQLRSSSLEDFEGLLIFTLQHQNVRVNHVLV